MIPSDIRATNPARLDRRPIRRGHVVAVTPDLRRVLVIRTQSTGWLLPNLEARTGPAFAKSAAGMLNAQTRRAETQSVQVVHAAPIRFDPSTGDSDWYCALLLAGSTSLESAAADNVELVGASTLAGTRPLLPIQQLALTAALARLRQPSAPFDSGAQASAAVDWATRQIEETTDARVLSIVPHRCARHEQVLRLHTSGGTMYFKGGSQRATDEGRLTELLWNLDNQQFPATVSLDSAADRWLYRELPGEPLTGPLLTASNVAMAVDALARIQKRAMAAPEIGDHLSERCMKAAELFARVDRIVTKVWTSECATGEAWRTLASANVDRCMDIDGWKLPLTLVLSDFWTQNVMSNASGIGFIDVEYSFWSYPILPLWRFIKDVERRQAGHEIDRQLVERTFARAWADLIPSADMTRLLGRLPFLGRLFSIFLASRELDLEERELGEALPGAYRARMLERHVEAFLGTPL